MTSKNGNGESNGKSNSNGKSKSNGKATATAKPEVSEHMGREAGFSTSLLTKREQLRSK
jgi:hypothetical protein